MSIHQFRVILVPKPEAENYKKFLEEYQANEDPFLEEIFSLHYSCSFSELQPQISCIVPEGVSDTHGIINFGQEDSDCISLLPMEESDGIEEIVVNFDCRDINLTFIKKVCILCQEYDLLMVYIHKTLILEPDTESLLYFIKNSWVKMVCEDPFENIPLLAHDLNTKKPKNKGR